MLYIVDELQTNNGQLAVIRTEFPTREQAESKYHAVLSAAAISSVEVHAAIWFDNRGRYIDSKGYEHPANGSEAE